MFIPTIDPTISSTIIAWYDLNHRHLPWRKTFDPYRIWLSEIILQQTRVAQGMDYYLRFVEHYPTVADLAAAPLDDVMKLWQGLGYYSRARNLHTAARQVVDLFGGNFPTHYKELLTLKGVGPYTAAAIASFTSGEAVAVVDGNVYRVIARLFDIDTPIDTPQGVKLFQNMADALLDPRQAGRHNQAMMEFGALQCTPSSPRCEDCPLQERCASRANSTIENRPLKQQKIKVQNRTLHYLIIHHDGQMLIHRRDDADIWQGLYDFVLIEKESDTQPTELLQEALSPAAIEAIESVTPLLMGHRHRLTHRLLTCHFFFIDCRRLLTSEDFTPDYKRDYRAINVSDWSSYATPKPISELNKILFKHFGCERQNNSIHLHKTQ